MELITDVDLARNSDLGVVGAFLEGKLGFRLEEKASFGGSSLSGSFIWNRALLRRTAMLS